MFFTVVAQSLALTRVALKSTITAGGTGVPRTKKTIYLASEKLIQTGRSVRRWADRAVGMRCHCQVLTAVLHTMNHTLLPPHPRW